MTIKRGKSMERYEIAVNETISYSVVVTAETPEAARAAALRIEPSNGNTPAQLVRVAGETRKLAKVGRPRKAPTAAPKRRGRPPKAAATVVRGVKAARTKRGGQTAAEKATYEKRLLALKKARAAKAEKALAKA